ncbi:MAG: efflux RND transporter periplasmic adaptor subunit, partial [Bacteroidota bacterium]
LALLFQSIAQASNWHIAAFLHPTLLWYQREGSTLNVSFPELPGKTLSATVSRMAHALDPESKTMRVEADLDNEKLELKPGMYAKISVRLKNEVGAMTVPLLAVSTVKGQHFIYKVNDGRVEKMEVELGLENKYEVEIRGARLVAEDQVIVKGKGLVQEGMAVRAMMAKPAKLEKTNEGGKP